ncbi:zinc-ribbon and DUF3426 domain-containing protein [Castellaniella sp.]|uniref:zinc-ribbon and DUF3426 domain-containing protein n=1 Tax=Castellaniella sp. TaxID=1955812 RepID=UPI003C730A5B
MDLTTRCPQCGTVFQASLSDLQLRKGYIRCVQCSHIFDGYAEVVSDASGSGAPSSAGPDDFASREPAAHILAPGPDAPDDADDGLAPQVFRSGRGRLAPDIGSGDREDDFWVDAPAGEAGSAESFVVEARPGHRSQGGTAAPLLRSGDAQPWWAGIVRLLARLLLVVLVVLMGAQLAYVYRAQLAQAVPAVRPWLERACVPLRCQVPYARDLAQLAITGSALKVQDAAPTSAGPSAPAAGAEAPAPVQRFILQATLRNQSDHAQEWPAIVLDLKDAAGTLLVRRNLSPLEYLGAELAGRPFAARSEVLIQVPLALDGLRINGYQLDLFYP